MRVVHTTSRINHFIRRLHIDWVFKKIIPFVEQIDRTNFQGDAPRDNKKMRILETLPRDTFDSIKQYDEKLTANYDDKPLFFWLCGDKLDKPYEEWELTITWGGGSRTYEIDLIFGTICGKDMQRVMQVNKDAMNELITAYKTVEGENKTTKSWD